MEDAASAITTSSPGWLAALDDEQAQARQRGLQALDQLGAAVHDLRASASAAMWLRGAGDGRFDRPAQSPMLGSVAASSSRTTANGQPLTADQLIGYLREVIEPPEQARQVDHDQAAPQLHVA